MLKESTTPQTPPAHAVINYVDMCGDHITHDIFTTILEDWAITLEEEAKCAEDRHKHNLLELADDIRSYAPDLAGCPPEPDPVAEARRFLAEGKWRAQKLLKEEGERVRRENTIKAAFCISEGMLVKIVKALTPAECRQEEFEATYSAASQVFEDNGWRVYTHCCSIPSHEQQEPLRQLAKLLERFPAHHLTRQVIEALGHALRWCENTSLNYPSPISGKANGIPPEGVLFPKLSLELVKVEKSRDIPKEWTGKLVKEAQA